MYILFAGLLLKSFHTHYISDKRKYFSFDDRRFTDDDYLKVQDLNIGRLEGIFLFTMLGLLLLALGVHLFIDPVLSIWFLGIFVAVMMLLSLIVDLKLYTVAHDRSHLVMAVIWLAVILGIFIFLFARGTEDVDMIFEDTHARMLPADIGYAYEEIESVEMVTATPDIPFNHNVLGTLSQRHGSFSEGQTFYSLNIEDLGNEMIVIVRGDVHTYINDKDETVTREWYETLQESIE
ncbi:hypothetical protein [Salinicoccus hispanicus]|nr:hypothetical protein [Salinicoccus hispanicus]